MDQLLTAGEQISISLLAMAIERMGFPVISLLGWQAGFNTNAVYGAARIKNIKPNRLQAELAKRNIVVVAGFQGLNRYDDLTTLGRGGSDTSAVAIAAALNADKCQIFTDEEGVYTADPRKVENAQKLKEITYDELLELAQKADLPVVNTLMGIGVYPESDERSLGMTGMHGHIASNMAVAQADVLVVAGSRFSDRVTGDRNRYVGQKTIIQLDIDPTEIDKNIATSLSVMGDVKQTLQSLLPLVQKAAHADWWQQIKAWDATEDRSLLAGDRLTAPWMMKELSRSFEGENPIYVTDVGQNQMWAAQHLVVDKPRHHLTSGGCGTMGFGLPGALGAAFAEPDKQVVHICGDGGFKMTGMELYTAAREGKKLISIVINNSCLGMVRQWQQLFYNEHYSNTLLTEFDFIGFAHSCGAGGRRAATCKEFKEALKAAREADKPFLIEVIVEQGDLVEPMVAAGAAVDDFVKINRCR